MRLLAVEKIRFNPVKKDEDIFVAVLPPHMQPKDCVADDLLLMTANEV